MCFYLQECRWFKQYFPCAFAYTKKYLKCDPRMTNYDILHNPPHPLPKIEKKNLQCIHSNIWVIRWLISWIKTLAKVTNKSHCFCYLSKMLEYLCVDSSKSLIILYAHFLHDSSHFPSYFNVCLHLNQYRPLPCFAKLSGDIGLYVEVHVMDKCWDKNFFFLYILHKARDL